MRAAVVIAYTSASASISGRVSRVLLTALVLISASLSLFAQNITVSPATLTFANQAVGSTSAAKTVSITNKGGSSQAVVIVPSAGFTETDNCNGNIAGGGSCKMSVYFAPTLVGKISGVLNINDESNNLLASVSLTGTGVAQTTLTPAVLAFGKGGEFSKLSKDCYVQKQPACAADDKQHHDHRWDRAGRLCHGRQLSHQPGHARCEKELQHNRYIDAFWPGKQNGDAGRYS